MTNVFRSSENLTWWSYWNTEQPDAHFSELFMHNPQLLADLWFSALQGAAGPYGPRGPKGPPGDRGPAGPQGQKGYQGDAVSWSNKQIECWNGW